MSRTHGPQMVSDRNRDDHGTDDASMPVPVLNWIAARVEDIDAAIKEMYALLCSGGHSNSPALTVQQAAKLLGRQPFTVREWCRNKRISATRTTARGPYAEWRIPMESIHYYQSHGLLPMTQLRRNSN